MNLEKSFEPELSPTLETAKKFYSCSICSTPKSCSNNDWLYMGTSKIYYCDRSECEAKAQSRFNNWLGLAGLPQNLLSYQLGNEPSDYEKLCSKKGCGLLQGHSGLHSQDREDQMSYLVTQVFCRACKKHTAHSELPTSSKCWDCGLTNYREAIEL